MHTVSVIIPTWNGLPLLQANLPALLAAEGVGAAEVIVADDGSTDRTAEWMQANFPQVKILRRKQNAGFSAICNAALAEARGDFVLLLNNDVRVTPGFLPPLIDTLASDPNVFAVNGRILLPDRRDEGRKTGRFHHGLFYVDSVQGGEVPVPLLYATGGAALYRRRMMEMLGGFDTMFSPAYWEDVDLSYRAWKRGWTVMYQPGSVVYHQHQATTSRLPRPFIRRLRARNGFLFQWKNFTGGRHMLFSVGLGLTVGLYQWIRDGEPSVLLGYRDAVRLWREAAVRRAGEQAAQVVPDTDILTRFAPERGRL